MLPTNPAHLAAGSALAGALWGLWQGRSGSTLRSPPPDDPSSGGDDGPAS